MIIHALIDTNNEFFVNRRYPADADQVSVPSFHSAKTVYSLVNVLKIGGEIRDLIDHELLNIIFEFDGFPLKRMLVAPTRRGETGCRG